MIRAHKIRLYPNKAQATYFAKACGVARFAYNWALAEWKRLYELGEPANEAMLRKRLNAVKREQFPWMLEVTKCAPQLAIRNDLHSAFRNYFRGLKGETPVGFPKFHKKGVHDSFSLSNDQFQVQGKAVKIPHLGWVRLAEGLRFEGKILGAAVSRAAGRWSIAIQVEVPDKDAPARESQAAGVDLGVGALAVLSDGTKVAGAKASRKYERQLKRLNQSLSRKVGAKKGEAKSNNFKKAKAKLARLHAKIADLRNDGTHKLTTGLVKGYTLIGIEDLHVKGMMGNHKLARAIADMSFFEFRRQLQYKAQAAGARVIVADQWFASSKLCSACGEKRADMPLHIREWRCGHCGAHHDRDVNAAVNLRDYALRHA